jgi:hypothetical protein
MGAGNAVSTPVARFIASRLVDTEQRIGV